MLDQINDFDWIANVNSDVKEDDGRKYNNEKLVKAGVEIETAVKDTITEGKFLTYDLGGNTRCSEVGNAIISKITNS